MGIEIVKGGQADSRKCYAATLKNTFRLYLVLQIILDLDAKGQEQSWTNGSSMTSNFGMAMQAKLF